MAKTSNKSAKARSGSTPIKVLAKARRPAALTPEKATATAKGAFKQKNSGFTHVNFGQIKIGYESVVAMAANVGRPNSLFQIAFAHQHFNITQDQTKYNKGVSPYIVNTTALHATEDGFVYAKEMWNTSEFTCKDGSTGQKEEEYVAKDREHPCFLMKGDTEKVKAAMKNIHTYVHAKGGTYEYAYTPVAMPMCNYIKDAELIDLLSRCMRSQPHPYKEETGGDFDPEDEDDWLHYMQILDNPENDVFKGVMFPDEGKFEQKCSWEWKNSISNGTAMSPSFNPGSLSALDAL